MRLSQILHKHDIHGKDLDSLVSALLEGVGLSEAEKRINGKISKEKIFAIVSCYAKEELEESISAINPQMTIDRMELNQHKQDSIQEIKKENEEIKFLSSVEEDLIFLESEKPA